MLPQLQLPRRLLLPLRRPHAVCGWRRAQRSWQLQRAGRAPGSAGLAYR